MQTAFKIKPQEFNLRTWLIIRDSIDKLTPAEIRKRKNSLENEIQQLPENQHSIYWKKELDYMNHELKTRF